MPKNGPSLHCPLCGNEIPPGVSRCPVCATDLDKVLTKRGSEIHRAADYVHRGLPEVDLPKPKLACPQCALELQGGEEKCPRCGIPLAGEKEMLECPECGALTASGSKSCPSCGITFEEPELPAPPVEEIPPPPEPPAPAPVPIHPTPEVVTAVPRASQPPGQGFTNGRGAVNGTGLVNGRGAVNGTGLVNGTGITNGTRAEGRALSTSADRKNMLLRRWQFLAVLIVIALVIPTFVFLSYSGRTATSIDGNFGEWADVEKFGIQTVASSADIAVVEWAVRSETKNLFMYVEVAGEVWGSSEVESYYLFVDSDNDPGTGYSASGIGADYLLELQGWDGSVGSTSLKEYGSPSDHLDWNSWLRLGPLSSANKGGQLEAMGSLPVTLSGDSKYLLLAQNNVPQRTSSVSYPVTASGGVLIVRQLNGVDVDAAGMIPSSTSVAIMRVVLSCEGNDGNVDSIDVSVTGATLVTQISDISLSVGQNRTIDVFVDTVSSPTSGLVTAEVTATHVSSTFYDVYIAGSGVRAYVAAPPASIFIDGAFGDWEGKVSPDADSTAVVNDNIDIDGVAAANQTAASYFYVSVSGQMCGGSYVPAYASKPIGGGGGIVIPTRKTGEDVLRVYIDSDLDLATGMPFSIPGKTIGANYMVEIRGLDGNIVSSSLMAYSSGAWALQVGKVVRAANDYHQIELSVMASDIAGSSSIDFLIETTDWAGALDSATSTPVGTRAYVVPTADVGIETWIVDGSTTSSAATATSNQRKLFYDGVNFWSFYYDGADTVYKYSMDNGVTWNLVGNAFSGTGITKASVWYNQANNLVFIVGDSTAASTTVHVRKGTVSPSTHAITWSGNDVTPRVSVLTCGSKNTYVSRDSSGYIWVMSTNLTQTTPNRYELSVFKSTGVDDITTWTLTGSVLGGGIPQSNSKGSVVNIGSGNTMLAVYGYGGNVASRTYTTSWSAETVIYAIGLDNPGNTDNAPPVVVVDGRGTAHVVYGNGHQQPSISKPYIYYVYYSGGSWSVPYRLESVQNSLGNLYPTISLDSSTGNLYAFWVEADSSGIGMTIMGKKNESGTWTALTFDPQTTAPKNYLTSVYSAPAETYICFQWTQNTTAPIQVIFDKIPEFSTVVLPTFAMALVLLIGVRRMRKERNVD